jgi:pimeloyl-ACP methyl ester carboxylesterase
MKQDVNGVRIHIATGGRDFNPKGKILVMLHGSGQNHLTFVLQARYLAHRGYDVLAPDFPGHGLSEGEPLASIEDSADWVIALLDVMGVETATIMGHSQGCLTALELAANHKSRIDELILIGAAMAIPVNEYLVDMSDKALAKAIKMMTSWGHGPSAHMVDNTQPGHSMLDYGRQVMDINNRAALLADLNACNAYQNGASAAAAITQPTLCILGGRDRMTPAKFGRKMADAITGSKMVMVDQAGHFLPAECPMVINDSVREFLGK